MVSTKNLIRVFDKNYDQVFGYLMEAIRKKPVKLRRFLKRKFSFYRSPKYLAPSNKEMYLQRLLSKRDYDSNFFISSIKNRMHAALRGFRLNKKFDFLFEGKRKITRKLLKLPKEFSDQIYDANKHILDFNIKQKQFLRKKKRVRYIKNNRPRNFFEKFPVEMYNRNPLNKFFKVNLELLTFNYDYLLNFHTAIGNHTKHWINPTIFSTILTIRNHMVLFDLSTLFIRLKKGIQKIFQVAKMRSNILGFLDSSKNYKFTGIGFDHFLRIWSGGYLTNYRRVIKNLLALKFKDDFFLTRRQKKFQLNHFFVRTVSEKHYRYFFEIKPSAGNNGKLPALKDFKPRIPAVPEFSFCMEDNPIWVNECGKAGVVSMCICDTQSFPQKIDYPLIANHRSLSFSFLIVKLVLESIICGKRIDYFSFIGINYVSGFLRKNQF